MVFVDHACTEYKMLSNATLYWNFFFFPISFGVEEYQMKMLFLAAPHTSFSKIKGVPTKIWEKLNSQNLLQS